MDINGKERRDKTLHFYLEKMCYKTGDFLVEMDYNYVNKK
jgi:hypothetical protein